MRPSDGMVVVALLASVAIVMLAAVAEMRQWLPRNPKAKAVLLFLAGASVIGVLAMAGVPPKWFDGSKEAFLLALSLLITAFIGPAKSFRLPLFLGIGGTLAALNVLPHL